MAVDINFSSIDAESTSKFSRVVVDLVGRNDIGFLASFSYFHKFI